jgi:GT2 family glycosyltransferase
MKITVIIPYKVDRGWLKNAVTSVPENVQLLLSQGEGCWPQNFNKALSQAEGDLIKFLHEDDMLTPNAISTYIKAFSSAEFKDVDFAHGNAYEIFMNSGRAPHLYVPKIEKPTLSNLLFKNVIHSASLIYRREVFEKIGGFDESPKVYSFEEYEFNLRCLKSGCNIGYINVPLAYYRRHSNQIIRTCGIAERKRNRAELINSYNNA